MDCLDGMKGLPKGSINCVLTSPPYNTGHRVEYWSNKKVGDKRIYKREKRYDQYLDTKTDEEYISWTINIFNCFSTVLAKNGCVLYNISYGNESPNLLWQLIAEIINNTDFCVADCIVWKKKNAVPNSTSKNKLTRICEFVFVFCRKTELLTFDTNKQVKTISNNGQKFYEVFYNYVEAKNNDEVCPLNKATYSSELCNNLLRIYVKKGNVVLDPFMGSGTTAVSCIMNDMDYVGFELSTAQCEYANKRIEKVQAKAEQMCLTMP